MTAALTDFLLARIAEDETVARAATPGPWVVRSLGYVAGGGATSLFGTDVHDAPADHEPDAEHIARHDPARVLAECEAKRRIVEHADAFADCEVHPGRKSETDCDECIAAWRINMNDEWYLRFLALPYADHPDYREEWKP